MPSEAVVSVVSSVVGSGPESIVVSAAVPSVVAVVSTESAVVTAAVSSASSASSSEFPHAAKRSAGGQEGGEAANLGAVGPGTDVHRVLRGRSGWSSGCSRGSRNGHLARRYEHPSRLLQSARRGRRGDGVAIRQAGHAGSDLVNREVGRSIRSSCGGAAQYSEGDSPVAGDETLAFVDVAPTDRVTAPAQVDEAASGEPASGSRDTGSDVPTDSAR